jgi:hypothetical protein
MSEMDEEGASCAIYPDAYAWILDNIRPVKPIPVKGGLGIFELDIDPNTLEFIKA